MGDGVSRGKSKKKGKKHRNKQHRASKKRPKQRARKNFPHQKVLLGPSYDGVKMSEVLEQFVEPYSEYAETGDVYRNLLTIATIAWNAMLLPDKDRQSHIDDFLAELPEELRDYGKKMVGELMERKERHFSHCRRMILDFDIEYAGDSRHLTVISTAVPV